jgi:hypothetical protein
MSHEAARPSGLSYYLVGAGLLAGLLLLVIGVLTMGEAAMPARQSAAA